jgi:hypothetical protein
MFLLLGSLLYSLDESMIDGVGCVAIIWCFGSSPMHQMKWVIEHENEIVREAMSSLYEILDILERPVIHNCSNRYDHKET